MIKKLLVGVVFFLSLAAVSKADPICWEAGGGLNLCLPFTQVDSTYMWDFVGKQSLVGGETTLGVWKSLQLTGGAVTSLDGKGTPFAGARLNLTNPTENWVPLAALHPGLFVGRDFRNNGWIYGIKFSLNVF